MRKRFFEMLLLAAVLASPAAVIADNDVDLPINGDFRGQPSGYSPAPGWFLTADGGGARILPTTDVNDFILELQASPTRSQSVVSDMFQLPGNILKLELKLSGNGTAAFGYELLDDTRTRVIAADQQSVQLAAYDQKIKRYFTLAVPARWIRIRLTAGNGSTARFRDVDADVSATVMAQPAGTVAAPAPAMAAPAPAVAAPAPAVAAPAPAVAAPAPATAAPAPAMAAPAPAVAAPAPAVAAPAPAVAAPAPAMAAPAPAAAAPAAAPAPAAAAPSRLLQNDKYYMYSFLGQDEHFETSIPTGSDIDFELGEDAGSSLFWRLTSYDPSVCRVKLKHEQIGRAHV